jgi:hypothetical protein
VKVRIVWAVLIADQSDSMVDVEVDTDAMVDGFCDASYSLFVSSRYFLVSTSSSLKGLMGEGEGGRRKRV